MSIHNILVPNNLHIFAREITSNVLNVDTLDVDDLEVNDLDVTGNITMNGFAGTTGQVLRKTSGTTQNWQRLAAGDITPGNADEVMVTNTAGTLVTWTRSLRLNSVTFTNYAAAFDTFFRRTLNFQTVLYNGVVITSNNTKSFQRTQQVVSMIFYDFSFNVVTPGFIFTSGVGDVPVECRPLNNVSFCVPIRNNNIMEVGKLTVSTAGTLALRPYSSAGFNAGIGGTDGNINVTWSIPN